MSRPMTLETRVCRLHAIHDVRVETEAVPAPGPGQALVRVGAGGICGSDMHYFHDGGIGAIKVREPIVLGHEAAGVIEALGEGVEGLGIGDKVALNPSRPCGECRFCREGTPRQCVSMRFNGSAMFLPHTQGFFRDLAVVEAVQCVKVAEDTPITAAACAEPTAVCLHAVKKAGDLTGKTVLVTGAGPIGALCTALARRAGAARVIVTDLQDQVLEVAKAMGATLTVNVREGGASLAEYAAEKGHVDVAFECSAAPLAFKTCAELLRPGGHLIQVGSVGEMNVPMGMLVGKEIRFEGSFRFDVEFAEAAAMISSGELDVRPIITGAFPMEEVAEAIAAAGDRSRSVKVHLTFA